MTRFSESIVIHCTPEAAFDCTQDYDRRLAWDTFLKKAELVNGASAADVGVRAWCVAHNGIGMETEYVSFRRPKVAAVKMTKGPWIFRSFVGSWNFRAAHDGTEVTFVYSFALPFPASLFTALMKRKLVSEVRQRLLDLKQYLEQATVAGG